MNGAKTHGALAAAPQLQPQPGRRRRGAKARSERRPERLERLELRLERGERFAASKWGLAPAAEALPPPPTHWRRDGRCRPEPDRALPLKLLLNVSVSA